MKNLKKWAPIIIIFVLVLSWYNVLNGSISSTNQYNDYVKSVEQALKDDIPSTAVENIELALAIKQSPDLVYMMADYLSEKGNHDECVNWCESYIDQFKKESNLYGYICKEYIELGEYGNCIELLEGISETDVYNKDLKSYYDSIKFYFEDVGDNYDYISSDSSGYCIVKKGEKYGTCSVSGELNIKEEYISIGGFSKVNEELRCTAVDSEGIAWILDESGNTKVNITAKLQSTTKYKKIGMISDNVFAICDSSDNYSLINAADFSVICSGYKYIGTSTYSMVPVQDKNGKWFFIKPRGERTSEKTYDDIKLTEFGRACLNEVAFVKTGGVYSLIDTNEKTVSDMIFSDCKAFGNESLTAVCKDKLWGFIDKNGKYIDGKYEDALPYKNGYAAFKKDGKWGFVDAKGKVAVENEFLETNGFVSGSTASIRTGDEWQIIKFYISESLEK